MSASFITSHCYFCGSQSTVGVFSIVPRCKTHTDSVLLHTLPFIPSETALPSAFIVSITSHSHSARPKCLHVFVNKLVRLSLISRRIISRIHSNMPHFLDRLKSNLNTTNAFCLSVRRAKSELWTDVKTLNNARPPLSAARHPWTDFKLSSLSSSSTLA